MLERARANDKITFLTNTQVVAIEGDPKVSGVRLRNTVTGEESKLDVTGVFVAVGHDPRSDLVRGQVELDDDGLREGRARLDRARRSRVCSPRATSSTTRTGKPSPPRAPAVRRRSTPNAG